MAPVSEDVKLLGLWSSPFVLRAQICLKLKSVEYEFLPQDLSSKSDLLLKSNPVYKKVPVLIHGDLPICESLIILQYIDETWCSGPQILPSDPYDRALARFWASFVDEKWAPPTRAILGAEGEEARKKIEESSEALGILEDAFIKTSKGHKFFGGETIGFVDIVVGSIIPWIKVIDELKGVNLIDETKTPNLFKWAQDFTSDSAIKDLLPETGKLVEYAKIIVARFKVPAS